MKTLRLTNDLRRKRTGEPMRAAVLQNVKNTCYVNYALFWWTTFRVVLPFS